VLTFNVVLPVPENALALPPVIMATLAATFIVLFPIGLLLASINPKLLLLYIAALVLQFVIVAIAARNYGTRFVLNVLTEESQTRKTASHRTIRLSGGISSLSRIPSGVMASV